MAYGIPLTFLLCLLDLRSVRVVGHSLLPSLAVIDYLSLFAYGRHPKLRLWVLVGFLHFLTGIYHTTDHLSISPHVI